MKRLMTIIATVIYAMASANAQSQFAVLDHNDTLTAFYGISAFNSAHDAAVNGDIITLSPGTFEAGSFHVTKFLTIRGAGMGYDSTAGTRATIISGLLTFDAIFDSVFKTKLEGIHFSDGISSLRNAKVNKCYLSSAKSSIYGNIFINSQIVSTNVTSNWHDNQFINSKIQGLSSTTPGVNNTIVNCVVVFNVQNATFISNYNIYNSILWNVYSALSNSGRTGISLVNSIYNCIGIWPPYSNNSPSLFVSTPAENHLYNVQNGSDIFKSGGDYELIDSLTSIYVGSDGTQIGIHGGNFPWNTSVRHPMLGRITPALQTRPDGKLEIEVEILPEE